MKKLLFAFLLISLGASAQMVNQTKSLCVAPVCPISYAFGTTDTVFVQINSSDGTAISYWRQLSGPVIQLPKDTAIWVTSLQNYDGFYLKGIPAGSYILQDSVVSISGSIAKTSVTFTVLPAPVSCPPLRTVTALTVTIFGMTIPIPPGQGTKISLSDGTTQTY